MSSVRYYHIVSVGRNCERFISEWYQSIVSQLYHKWYCTIVIDPSTDHTIDRVKSLVAKDNRFKLIINTTRNYCLYNTYLAIKQSRDDNDIIVTLDLDDSFYHQQVLDRVDREYADPNVWMTYGSYFGTNGDHAYWCGEIPKEVWDSNSLRSYRWSTSALRTFKKRLWDKISPSDFLMPDGSWIKRATDRAFMYPMLEMAGPTHVRYIRDILYKYNVYGQQPGEADIENNALQYILSKPPYKRLDIS